MTANGSLMAIRLRLNPMPSHKDPRHVEEAEDFNWRHELIESFASPMDGTIWPVSKEEMTRFIERVEKQSEERGYTEGKMAYFGEAEEMVKNAESRVAREIIDATEKACLNVCGGETDQDCVQGKTCLCSCHQYVEAARSAAAVYLKV